MSALDNCCVPSCPGHIDGESQFSFPFPKDPRTRLMWMWAILNADECRVCADHFVGDDFVTVIKSVEGHHLQSLELKEEACPTQNLPNPVNVDALVKSLDEMVAALKKKRVNRVSQKVQGRNLMLRQLKPKDDMVKLQPKPVPILPAPGPGVKPPPPQMKLLLVNPASKSEPDAQPTVPTSPKSGDTTPVRILLLNSGPVKPSTSLDDVTARKLEEFGIKQEQVEDGSSVTLPSTSSALDIKVGELEKCEAVTCTVCHKTIARKRDLARHMRVHQRPLQCEKCGKERGRRHSCPQAEKKYICDLCGVHFTQRYRLTLHVMEEHGIKANKSFQCEKCGHMFVTDASLAHHVKLHAGSDPLVCDTCGSIFFTTCSLNQHIKVHTGDKPFSCDECGRQFLRYANLTQHLGKHAACKSFTCETCSKTFSRQHTLTNHMRLHTGEKPHVCGLCGKSYSLRESLIVHQRHHTGERPYECHICNNRYFVKSALRIHIQRHLGVKQHMCEACGKTFGSKSAMNRHSLTHTGERPYSCDVCERSFSLKSSLDSHRMIHTGERPYKCEICEKAFPYRTSLIFHRRTHTGERPFICDVCSKSFVHKQALENHIRIHTGEKPFMCEACGKAFRSKQKFTMHKRLHAAGKKAAESSKELPKDAVQVHLKILHPNTHEKTIFVCGVCGDEFDDKETLTVHVSNSH